MELRHLRYFIAVAEHLHFGRAAKALRTAQPSLSQQIRNLEREIGVLLLERNRHRVQLTAAGYAFLEEARILVSRSDRSIALARETAEGRLGTVRVAFSLAALGSPLVSSMHAFAARYPSVTLSATMLSDREQFARLADDRIDVGFAHEGTASEVSSLGLQRQAFLTSRIEVALPATHRLIERDELRIGDVRGERLLLLARSADPALFERVMEVCASGGYSPPTTQEVAEEAALIALVAAGLGIALVPDGWRTLHLEEVVFRAFVPTTTIDLAIFTRNDSTNPALRAFLAGLQMPG